MKFEFTKKNILESSYKLSWICLIIFSVVGIPTIVLVNWYIIPVMDGMNMTLDYLNSENENQVMDIIGFDEEEVVSKYTDRIEDDINNERNLEKSLEGIFDDIEQEQINGLRKLYSVLLFEFAPLITMPAVVYFHIWIWFGLAKRIMKWVIK